MRLTLLLDMAADEFGDRVLAGRRSGGITAAGLARRSHAGAALVRERAADALVYLGAGGLAFPVALLAAARAGVPLVPLSYRLGERQLGALLARHPKALGIADPAALPHLTAAGLDAMTAPGAPAPNASAAAPDPSMMAGTQIGKRYVDQADTIQVLCTRAGRGTLALDGEPLAIQAARPLPASD